MQTNTIAVSGSVEVFYPYGLKVEVAREVLCAMKGRRLGSQNELSEGLSFGTKEYATTCGPQTATFWLTRVDTGHAGNCLRGSYWADGINVLFDVYVFLPNKISRYDIEAKCKVYFEECEDLISETDSRKEYLTRCA